MRLRHAEHRRELRTDDPREPEGGGRAAGAQGGPHPVHGADRLTGWPGEYICAEGRYQDGAGAGGSSEKRAGIFIGPEFGTVSRPDLVEAAREAGDAGFDVLIACAFNYEAHANEFHRLGHIPVLKAHMNVDLHMAADLKATGKGNLFVIFGEPDIEILELDQPQVRDGAREWLPRIRSSVLSIRDFWRSRPDLTITRPRGAAGARGQQ